MINTPNDVARRIEEILHNAEGNGVDREETAETLEALAEAVRNGHSQLPENRGSWWEEVHGGEE